MSWNLLDSQPGAVLAAAVREAHWAVQTIAAAGETHLTHAADTSHTAMSFDPARRAFMGEPLPINGGVLRVAVAVATLSISIVDADGNELGARPLAGATFDDAMTWTDEALHEGSRGSLTGPLVRPAYAMPTHALESGARFETDGPALTELAAWYATAQAAMVEISEREEVTPILCWPHHFDLATLIVARRSDAGEMTATIGVGLSPGDDAFEEPYWYVNFWPHPPRLPAPLPLLPGGRWHTDGFVAAVLPGSEIASQADGEDRARLVRTFLDAAIAANRALLS